MSLYQRVKEQLKKDADNGYITTDDVANYILQDKEKTHDFIIEVLETNDDIWDKYLNDYIETEAMNQEDRVYEARREREAA